MITEYLPGGTLRDLVQAYGAIPPPLARSILRQVVLGLGQLRERGDDAPVLLDLDMVMLDTEGVAKLEAPLLGVTTTTTPTTTARPVAPPPELLLLGQDGDEDLGKADTCLLGVVAAQMLTGKCDLVGETSAGSAAARIREFQESSAVELLVPEDAAGKLDGDALDLIRQCLSM